MKEIKTEDAIGCVLCHDITQIIKDKVKGPRFKKGHIIKEEDIPVLLSLGKDHIYIDECDENMMHENDAAEILCKICMNDHMTRSDVSEGKIEIKADVDGLLKVNTQALYGVNSYGNMMIASIQNNSPVKKGDQLVGTRIIPLVIEKEKMMDVEKTYGKTPILQLLPYQKKKAVVFTTGNEVYYGRIEDTFTPVIIDKLNEYDCEVIEHHIFADNDVLLTEEIKKQIDQGVDIIICTGGMSIDPDDKTPLAIKNSGADIVSYGAPVLPGAMFLLAYAGKTSIMGLPGCVMYARRTIFDLILPRVIADDEVTSEELAKLGHGGLCLNCDICTFPHCGFGKGGL